MSGNSYSRVSSPGSASRKLALARISRHNMHVTDVPVYIAVITGAAGIIGAGIPQASIVLREVRQAKRDRRERSIAAGQSACIDLLRAASSLSARAENLSAYRGDAKGLGVRLEELRKYLA